MASTSIILPQKLVVRLRAKAEETDLLPDELAAEILFKGLGEELDPEDLVQASEKLWGAAALIVKMVAAKRGLKLEQHGGLWVFINNQCWRC